ncbi:BlaI/MecI/CopY family transcriptional regulator [Marinilongibacter aquaticus]|uniref:BlaI/MecI/CopY family transcriptional regulator n=1 Tax=Marinilongibacter aquaticus TaxID=2975157 RepID=UPI0021BD9991|nr:BlaI/MecI/CopY family transcriptional regulator [Marinilongibacter aquaticus]UBM60072.1 BlaI/MecI/CopY family transcriptional regulator [Marinilongibacter aquaticus]
MEMRELTKAEEEIMQVLWGLEKAFVKNVIAELPDPKPAYNTVSTIIRILEQKGFVDHEAYGKSYAYFPLISKDQYRKFASSKLMSGYFEGSVGQLVSFFVEQEKIDLNEADEILQMLENLKNKDQ